MHSSIDFDLLELEVKKSVLQLIADNNSLVHKKDFLLAPIDTLERFGRGAFVMRYGQHGTLQLEVVKSGWDIEDVDT